MPEIASYWQKNGHELNLAEELSWNFPEQKRGAISIVGGNANAFSTEVKITDYISKHFPMVKSIKNHFPDALKNKLPPFEGISFYPSTENGSFSVSSELTHCTENSDITIISGDLSKNSITAIAITKLLQSSETAPFILTRDAVDLTRAEAFSFAERNGIFFVASLAQIQKLFRALFYPRPLLLSQPIFPIIETLHKFTLSYPVSILTFHEGKIICADSGNIITIDLEKTSFTPLSLWSGDLAARLAVFAMYNPKNHLESMVAAVNYK